MIERQKRNPKVLNRLEVYPRDVYHVAMEELKTYGGKVMLFPQQLEVYLGRRFRVAYEEAMKYGVEVIMRHFTLQVGNKLEVLGRRFRVAYDEAMKYGVGVMMNRRFPILVALCDGRPLEEKIAFMRATIEYNNCPLRIGLRRERFCQARSSRLWRLCVLQLLMWIQSGAYFGWKK
ncbi:uncharacterized protein LOC115728150 isoform X1 [Rhodamnia argentea]|uniref:Uncharacterized protein LOC115728150 isoform X1 n=1 Tax=Rhodamnia argentea TaxID=178133 RepID=A0ABM3HRC4_9MYRT|nr:uncharacterized protein LOC115728150 isoform X1 [Rhodamnia argentea]